MIRFLKIVAFLGKNIKKKFTMHELSKLLNIPYASFYRTVQRMIEHKVLVVETIGHSKAVQLNLDHPILRAHLTHASFDETTEYLEHQQIIKKIANELKTKDVVVVFGSYAKHAHTEKSDIDLLIINKNGKKNISFSKYELLFKKKINPIFVTKKEFESMLKSDQENVGKQVLKNHIILANHEEFWGSVLDAIR